MMDWPPLLRSFLQWLAQDRPDASADPTLEEIRHRFERVARSLSRSALAADTSAEGISLGSMLERTSSSLFLGLYSTEGMRYAFEQFGLIDALAARGLENLVFDIVPRGRFQHHFRLFCDGRKDPSCMVAELLVGVENQLASAIGVPARGLNIQWILLQNPKAPFTAQRPPLPGQRHPGLGLGREVLTLLALVIERMELDGMWSVPDHLHNAVLYSVRFQFADPEAEGRFQAVRRDTQHLPLSEVAWAAARGRLLEVATGRPLPWPLGLQVAPRSSALRAYYESDDYCRRRDQTRESTRYVIEWAVA